MKRSIDFTLVLPCLNEAGIFAESVSRIRSVLDASPLSYEIIFVDDKSTDGTQVLIAETGFRAIFHAKNYGRGRSVADGIRAAKGSVVGYIDIDCEVDPMYMPKMVAMILAGRADVVIGKRYYRTSLRAIVRELLSRGYQWLSDKMVDTGRLDTESGYKFFRRKTILPLLAKARNPGWFWDTEIMVYAKRAGLVIVEEPVLFLRRFDKQSSVHVVRDTMDYLVHLWKLRSRLV